MSDEVRLDWSRAEVEDGGVEVPFAASPPNGWMPGLETLLFRPAVLGTRHWGTYATTDGSVVVTDVDPGYEGELRESLDKLVEHANRLYKAEAEKAARVGGGTSDADMERRFRDVA